MTAKTYDMAGEDFPRGTSVKLEQFPPSYCSKKQDFGGERGGVGRVSVESQYQDDFGFDILETHIDFKGCLKYFHNTKKFPREIKMFKAGGSDMAR